MFGIAVWVACFPGEDQVRDRFFDVPANAWYFDAMKRVKRECIFFGYSDSGHVNPNSRYERALQFHSLMVKVKVISDCASKPGASTSDRVLLMRSLSLFPFMDRALREFGYELRELGVTGDAGFGRIKAVSAELARTLPSQYFPFSDVPDGHWASQAVGEMRALGLISGYPDVKFRG